MSYFIGIDSSTTATKALLTNEQGSILGVGRSTYDFETPHPLWSEQSPDLWWNATIAAINEVLSATGVAGSDINGIGLTGQMHGLVMLDGSGRVLRPSILWNDQRTQIECDEIRSRIGRTRLILCHRERRIDRLHGSQDPVGKKQRTKSVRQDRTHPSPDRTMSDIGSRASTPPTRQAAQERSCSTLPTVTGRPRSSTISASRASGSPERTREPK